MTLTKTFLAMGISIVLFSFIAYTIYTFYKGPSYPEYNQTDYTQKLEKYREDRKRYSSNMFIIFSIIGLLTTFIGISLSRIETVGSGIIGGGILTILSGIVIGWSSMNEYVRILVLGSILAFLIYLAYKKIEKK